MTIQQMQQQIDEWIKLYGVRYFDEMTNTLILQEEMGEFSRLVARIYGEQSFKNKPIDRPKDMLADEMADMVFVITCLANQMDIDLENAMINNLEKKTGRDKNRHQNNEKLK
jgi:NTP pyrophosphatase (non-canonical NTP hydrolase)